MKKACISYMALLAACSPGVRTLKLEPVFDCAIPVSGTMALLKFDTGSMCSVFDRTEAELLSLTIERGDTTVISKDSSGAVAKTNHFVHNVELQFGALTCTAEQVPVMSLDPRMTRANQTQQSHRLGLLGMDVMQLHATWFDAPNQRLHVIPAAQAESFVTAQGRVVTGRITLGKIANRPMIKVLIENERTVELLLDTGASSTTIPAGLAAELALPSGDELEERRRLEHIARMTKQLEDQGLVGVKVEMAARDGSTVGIHGEATGARPLHHVRSLKVGNREFVDLIVTEDEQSLVLGADVLATFEWILHGPKRELWLLKGAN